MEENDISDVINKFSDILKEKDIKLDDYIDNSITNENISNNNINNDSNSETNSQNGGLNIDINTILKFKNIAEKLNGSNNPRKSLLQALKPFLSSEKQGKIDEYIKMVNILSILEVLNKDLLG